MKMYRLPEDGGNRTNIEFALTKNYSYQTIMKTWEQIRDLLKDGLQTKPKKLNYLVIVLMAGHGILKDGE